MPTTEDGQQQARLLVAQAMAAQELQRGDLSRSAGIDPGTLGDFLDGHRWPKAPTQGKIERALGWEPGTIAAARAGVQVDVGARGQDQGTTTEVADFLYQRPEGVADEEWERVKDRAAAYLDGLIDSASRER